MKYLVFGPPLLKDYPAYRGTYRIQPYYISKLKDEHPANQAFFAYLREQDELGTVDDRERAQNIVEEYARLNPPQYFEIVMVPTTDEPLKINTEFLGYDLSNGLHFSLLAQGLSLSKEQQARWSDDEKLRVLFPLFRLIGTHFAPRLNTHLLFDAYEDAKRCLECMMSLQTLYPNLWESDTACFEIVALYQG